MDRDLHVVFIPPDSTIPSFVDSLRASFPPDSDVLDRLLSQIHQFLAMRLSLNELQHHLFILLHDQRPSLFVSFVSNLVPVLMPNISEYAAAQYDAMVQAGSPDIYETVRSLLKAYVKGIISLHRLNAEVLPLLVDRAGLTEGYFNLVPRSRHLQEHYDEDLELEIGIMELELELEDMDSELILEEDGLQPLQEPEEIDMEHGDVDSQYHEDMHVEQEGPESDDEVQVVQPVAEEVVQPVAEEVAEEAEQTVAEEAGQPVVIRVINFLLVVGVGIVVFRSSRR